MRVAIHPFMQALDLLVDLFKGMEMQHQKNKFVFRLKAIHLAVAALPMMTGWIPYANADCTPDPVTSGGSVVCTGADANGFNAGVGVNNLSVAINAGAVVQPNITANPSIPLYVNAGNTIVNNGRIENIGGSQVNNYLVNLNGSDNTFTNNGEMVLSVRASDITTSAQNTRTLRGFYTSSPSQLTPYENITIVNKGIITLEHAGIGNAQGFYPGEEIDGLVIDNSGTISVHRTSPTLTVSVGTSAPTQGALIATSGIAGTGAAGALGIAAAISSDDDAEMSVINRKGGLVEATGDYASAIYARAVEIEVQNAGTIRSNAIAISAHGGLADGTHGELEITNTKTGKIIGDILAVDGNALRYWAKEAKGLTGLTLNNQAGLRDSEIENQGSIMGDIYLGSGTHKIENEGTITGKIDVNQNGIGAPVGAREFTLENEGKLTGNITIHDVAGAVNTITLVGNGFTGSITATTGDGDNTLNLLGGGTLGNDVSNFTTLNLGAANGGGSIDDDEGGLLEWTLAAGKTFEFSDTANINSGLLYVSGNLIANTIVNEDGILSGDGTITGNLANNGTVAVDMGKTLSVTGNAVFNDDSAFAVGVSSTGSGKLAVTGTADFDDDAVVKPIVVNSVIKNGNSFTLLTSSGLTGTPQVQSSALVKWDVTADPNNLILTANVQNAGASGVTGASNSSLTSLLSFDSALGAQFQNLETDAEVRKAAEQLRPEVNGASLQAVQSLTDRVYGLVGAHLGETHLAKASGNSGVASGDAANDSGVWFQGFGGRGDQGRRNGVDGYDINAYGFAAGADTLVSDSNVRVGAALSYGQSNVEDKGARTGNRTDINSYQGLAYASWLFDQWYLNAALGLGQHKFDDKKLVLGNKITGSHDAWQYSVRVDAGYPIQFGSARLIPVASMTYNHLNQDSYTENGSGAQKISADNTDSLRSGLGLKALFPLYEGGVNASLELRTIWNHELADRSQDMTARFVGGGSAYTVKGLDLPRDSANLGASLRVSSVGQSLQQSLLLSYDAEVKNQFTSHTARLQARFDF